MRFFFCSMFQLVATAILLSTAWAKTTCPPNFMEYEKYASSAGQEQDNSNYTNDTYWVTWSMDADGDTAVMASLRFVDDIVVESAVSVWELQPQQETWTEQTPQLWSSDNHYLIDVGISGPTIVVGLTNGEDDDSERGSVLVFALGAPSNNNSNTNNTDSSPWTLKQTLFSPDNATAAKFGLSVDTDNETIAVGSPLANSVYVFVRSDDKNNSTNNDDDDDDNDSWIQKQILNPGFADSFGTSVGVHGSILAIGTGTFVAVIYQKQSDDEEWDRRTTIIGSPGLGRSVDVDAAGKIVFGLPESNQVYIFRNLGVSAQVVSGGGPGFGRSVSLDNNLLAVGAAVDGSPTAGRAFLYQYNGEWSLQQEINNPSNGKNLTTSRFGISTALDAGQWLVGAAEDSAACWYGLIQDSCSEAPSTPPTAVPSSTPSTLPSAAPTTPSSVAPASSPLTMIPSGAPSPAMSGCYAEEHRCGPAKQRYWMQRNRLLGVTCRSQCTYAFLVPIRQRLGWKCGRCDGIIVPLEEDEPDV